MQRPFVLMGIACILAVVILSLVMHWYVKKYADTQLSHVSQNILRGSLVRTLLCVVAALLFLLSSVVA